MSDEKSKVMKLDHVSSQISFRDWLKKNLIKDNGSPLYKHDDVIPKEHIFIFLNHIESQIKSQLPKDHRDWALSIKKIRERLDSNE